MVECWDKGKMPQNSTLWPLQREMNAIVHVDDDDDDDDTQE